MKKHNYKIKIEWTGNEGSGTKNYKTYNRNHSISGDHKSSEIDGSSDPSFLGDKTRYNPEDLFLSSISSCHMLWYLHLCSAHNIIITSYYDNATGIMEEKPNGSGQFTSVTLNPTITITNNQKKTKALELHEEANKMCFIANSCNFKIKHNCNITIKEDF
ncbi:OsmC family protein [Maribacter sp.]|uniref:OsmC family protein n=1 Tax=Maribacter sp. TaxID=1897614 RepID=UPI0025C51429|nr:OsmC family protein [Maribacter sp.]